MTITISYIDPETDKRVTVPVEKAWEALRDPSSTAENRREEAKRLRKEYLEGYDSLEYSDEEWDYWHK